MSSGVYGGDEISAIVLDAGSYTTRIGFAGEDTPRAILDSAVGRGPRREDETKSQAKTAKTENGDDSEQIDFPRDRRRILRASGVWDNADQNCTYYLGDTVHYPRSDVDIVPSIQDGVVADWEAAEQLWTYGLTELLAADMTEHPLLMTEPAWNSNEARARYMELAFETYNVPAFYVVRTPVCNLFAAGKSSGLVVDVGADLAAVTPVVDGIALRRPARRSKKAGRFLEDEIRRALAAKDSANLSEIVPHYKIASKLPVEPGMPAKYTPKALAVNVSSSYDRLQTAKVLQEIKEAVCQVADGPYKEETESNLMTRSFEFPNGYNAVFSGSERLSMTETLFVGDEDDQMDLDDEPTKPEKPEPRTVNPTMFPDPYDLSFCTKGLTDMVVECINACDVDMRSNLANNIVITGSSTFLQGFTDRVNNDLTKALSGLKIRLYAPAHAIERKYSAWIGGSILASLGTFHQLWVSRKEYDEAGAEHLLEKRFR